MARLLSRWLLLGRFPTHPAWVCPLPALGPTSGLSARWGSDESSSKAKKKKKKSRYLDFNPQPENEVQCANLAKFQALEAELIRDLDWTRLSPEERNVHECHQEAIQDFQLTYIDPVSGLKCFSRLRHFIKGRCCGSACRHCIYQHDRVKPERKAQRLFNTAFWCERPP